MNLSIRVAIFKEDDLYVALSPELAPFRAYPLFFLKEARKHLKMMSSRQNPRTPLFERLLIHDSWTKAPVFYPQGRRARLGGSEDVFNATHVYD